jgi:hypothetical protein
MMSLQSKRNLLTVVALRDRRVDRKEKSRCLDNFVERTGYTRKHAVAIFKHPPQNQSTRPPPVRRQHWFPSEETDLFSGPALRTWVGCGHSRLRQLSKLEERGERTRQPRGAKVSPSGEIGETSR